MAGYDPQNSFESFDEMRQKWGDDACIQVLDGIVKNGQWMFLLWDQDIYRGWRKWPEAVVKYAEINPITHVDSIVGVLAPGIDGAVTISGSMESRRWLTEHQELLAAGENHGNPIFHRWWTSLFDKKADHVG
ncbi:MAG: hypothetical protein OXG68_02320 [Chloroflexi bacterium]|nr:hypothetical protein [Chloroflexota bacterium]